MITMHDPGLPCITCETFPAMVSDNFCYESSPGAMVERSSSWTRHGRRVNGSWVLSHTSSQPYCQWLVRAVRLMLDKNDDAD